MTENTNPCSGPEEPGYKQTMTQLEHMLHLCISALLQHRFTAQTLNIYFHCSQAAVLAHLRVLAAQLWHHDSLYRLLHSVPLLPQPPPNKGWVIGP